MKRIIRFFLSISFMMIILINGTYAMVIHEESLVEEISPSISYIERTQFNTNKWIIIKSFIVDISDEQTSIQALYNNDNLSDSRKLSDLAQMKDNILGAINGDFFIREQNTAIGPLIDQKKLIYNGTHDSKFNVFGITRINNPFIGHIDNFIPEVKVGSTTIPVTYKNKNYTDLDRIVLLDNSYAESSIGNSTTTELTEVVIENNKVVEIRFNKAPISIPHDGYVIAIPKSSNFNINQISIGNEFILNNPKILDALNTLIGGGSILVKGGEINNEFSLPINGNHPRSAIGFTKDYSKVIMTTVEGRRNYVPGVTETELAEIMIDAGAYYAINLDGGGSSTLIKRDYGKFSYQPINYLSDGVERRVYNGIGVASNYPTKDIYSLQLELSHEHTILEQPIALDVSGSDLYYNPITFDNAKIEYSSTLKGEFIDRNFYPKETGKGFITVKYNGLTQMKPIEVHKDLAEITFNKYHLNLSKGEKTQLKAEIITSNGYRLDVDLTQLDFNLPESTYSINKDEFLLREDLQDQIITATYGDLKTQLSLNVNSYETILLDDFETLKGKHVVYPLDLNGKFNLFNTSIDGSTSGRLFYDFTKHPTETRASYYVYENSISVDEDASKIKLDVFGAFGKNHWLRLRIKDQAGKEHNLTLARNIDWKGWKTLETEIPNSIEGPISIERIYIVETDFSNVNNGLLLIDNLRAEIPIQINLEKETAYKNIFDKDMDMSYKLDNLYVTNENIEIDSLNFKLLTNNKELLRQFPEESLNTNENYSSSKDSSKLIIKLNNKDRTLNNDDGSQWLYLKEKLQKNQSQNLIFYLSNPVNFKNNLEKELFFKLLKEHQKRNYSNIFIISGSNKFKLEYMEGLPIINLDPTKPFELRFNFIKSFAKFNLELK